MNKRQEERLALEGNSVFQDLRMQRDALLEALERMVEAISPTFQHPALPMARAAIRTAKGES